MSHATYSRRRFLTAVGAGIAASAVRPLSGTTQTAEIKSRLNGPIGLQLYSLREYLPKDFEGTLRRVRAMGFREVESAGLLNRTVGEFRAALDAAGLRCQSAHIGFERMQGDLPGALTEAKALGATWVVIAWIPHEGTFGRDHTLAAADAFNRFGKAAWEAGLVFAYHCHGYEFVPSPDGTLFDTLAKATDPQLVKFQMDIFHAYHGGADPAKLIAQHAGRIPSLHLKDLARGVIVKPGTATAKPDVDVPLGTGQIDMPAVLRAAMKAKVQIYYLEDESADPLAHIPKSLAYLQNVSL